MDLQEMLVHINAIEAKDVEVGRAIVTYLIEQDATAPKTQPLKKKESTDAN